MMKFKTIVTIIFKVYYALFLLFMPMIPFFLAAYTNNVKYILGEFLIIPIAAVTIYFINFLEELI